VSSAASSSPHAPPSSSNLVCRRRVQHTESGFEVSGRRSPKSKGLQLKLLTGAKSRCLCLKDDTEGAAFEGEAFASVCGYSKNPSLPVPSTHSSTVRARLELCVP